MSAKLFVMVGVAALLAMAVVASGGGANTAPPGDWHFLHLGAGARDMGGATKTMEGNKHPEFAALIVRKGAFLVAGTGYQGENKQGDIPRMWETQFLPRMGELDAFRSDDRGLYGVGRALAGVQPGPFEYLAAAPVRSLENLPKGMVGWGIPAHSYAVFPAHDVPDIGPVVNHFYRQWLPKSEYREAGNLMLEYYPEDYDRTHIIYLYFPVQPKQGPPKEPVTIYHPEPKIVEKGEIRLVGVEGMIVDGLTLKTKKAIPSLYGEAARRMGEIGSIRNPMVMVGDNRTDDPGEVWASGPGCHHMAGFEVSEFQDVPKDMVARLIPASKYAVFACDAPVEAKTQRPLAAADWGPVFPYYAWNRRRWGFGDKAYYLEFFHHADIAEMRYPVVHYELWIPLE